MTVKKCDRCGKIFDANEDNGERAVLVYKYEDICSRMPFAESKADLCADCIEAYKEWLNKGTLKHG